MGFDTSKQMLSANHASSNWPLVAQLGSFSKFGIKRVDKGQVSSVRPSPKFFFINLSCFTRPRNLVPRSDSVLHWRSGYEINAHGHATAVNLSRTMCSADVAGSTGGVFIQRAMR